MKTNADLQRAIIDALQFELELRDSSTEIGVIVIKGAVTLTGEVETYAKKLAAERAAKQVKGVTVVAMDLEVVPLGEHQHSDLDIAVAIKEALKWHAAVEDDKIKVLVENGWVYLDGKVNFFYQRVLAEKAIVNLIGIIGVTNRITILSPQKVDSQQLKEKISDSFPRNATIDSDKPLGGGSWEQGGFAWESSFSNGEERG